MKKINTSIFILGGGPGGSTAAIAARNSGFDFLIADRQSFPRDKTCGDGITYACIKILEEIGLDSKIFFDSNEFHKARMIQVYSGQDCFQVPNDLFFTMPRTIFDTILWEEIPTENKIKNIDIQSIEFKEGKYHIIANDADGKVQIESDYLIGGDGYSSLVKRTFFKELEHPKRIACRYYLEVENDFPDTYDFYFEEGAYPGYYWIFKLSGNRVNTGVYPAGLNNESIFELHQKFIRKHFGQVLKKENFYTWTIPNQTDFSVLTNEKCLLIGDAAGLCDTLIGHGIDAAILSAFVAVKSIQYHQGENPKKYPLSEIYRYNLNTHFKDLLKDSKDTYDQLMSVHQNSIQTLKNYFDHVIH